MHPGWSGHKRTAEMHSHTHLALRACFQISYWRNAHLLSQSFRNVPRIIFHVSWWSEWEMTRRVTLWKAAAFFTAVIASSLSISLVTESAIVQSDFQTVLRRWPFPTRAMTLSIVLSIIAAWDASRRVCVHTTNVIYIKCYIHVVIYNTPRPQNVDRVIGSQCVFETHLTAFTSELNAVHLWSDHLGCTLTPGVNGTRYLALMLQFHEPVRSDTWILMRISICGKCPRSKAINIFKMLVIFHENTRAV